LVASSGDIKSLLSAENLKSVEFDQPNKSFKIFKFMAWKKAMKKCALKKTMEICGSEIMNA
jgi:hypothetical protein